MAENKYFADRGGNSLHFQPKEICGSGREKERYVKNNTYIGGGCDRTGEWIRLDEAQ